MENYRDRCVLNWKGGKKTVPFQSMTNVPVFYTAPSSHSYRAFAATLEAMEAPYFQRERVLQFPGRRDLMDDIVSEEFVMEENLNYDKEASVDEGNTEDNKTIKTLNLPPPPPADKSPSKTIRLVPSPLTPCLTKKRVKTPRSPLLTIKPS
jgi:hypothetical protein